MRLIILTLGFVFSLAAIAEEIKMAVISSDIDKELRDFYLVTNSRNEIDSIRYVTYLPTGQILDDTTVPAERVIQDGVVIVERDGRDAVRLQTDSGFTVQNGGGIILNYLFSGVTGTRRLHRLVVKRVDSMYFLKNTNDAPVNRILVLGNWNRVLGLIGIRDIQSSYKH